MAKRETKARRTTRERNEQLEMQLAAELETARVAKQKEQTLKDQIEAYRKAGVVRIETCSCHRRVWVRTKLGLLGGAEA